MRTNLRDSVKPDMLAPNTRAKIVARNTFQFIAPNGDKVTRLHQTNIVRVTPEGKIILDSKGYKTVTTKDRMNRYAAGVQIWQRQGQWTLHFNGKSVPYYDGITLPDCFAAKMSAKATTAQAREQKMRLQVRKFCDKLDKLECLPEPSSGDCWYCCMCVVDGADKGKPLGEATSNSEHLLAHIKEGYLHGSLLLNALRWAGYPNAGFIFTLEQHGRQQRRKLHNGGSIKRALRRYLYRQLGLAA